MNLAVLNTKGEETGRKVKLSDSIFKMDPNDHAIYLDVKLHLASLRQGTHKTKERAEVRGSTRKVKRQKGTGTARMGSLKSPILRGGGRVFGPRPKDYTFKLNKKVKKLARKSALAYKAKNKELTVIEDFTFDAPKTKSFADLLKSLSMADKKTLIVLPQHDRNVFLSCRNLKGALVSTADMLNTYDVLNYDNLVLCEGSVEKIENILN
jgi:large subunit ribosomal protein L4